MLDRNIFPTEVREVTKRVNVTEQRAPTDESVKLLIELEAAARAKILASARVDNTEFSCVVHFEEDIRNSQAVLQAVFKLNGVELMAEYRYSCFKTPSKIDVLLELRDNVAREIANHISRAFTKDLHARLNLSTKG